jgi:hypothetical protein
MYSQKKKLFASVPIPASPLVSVSDLYIPRIGAERSWKYINFSQIYCMSVGIGRQNIIILFEDNEAAQFHLWEYINGNQTFILDSHRPFICSVYAVVSLVSTVILRC